MSPIAKVCSVVASCTIFYIRNQKSICDITSFLLKLQTISYCSILDFIIQIML
ncbi:hypothetical protein Syun_021287 [Stephania yunnanensis]|uniref:Uncharacterized protein n=1 Tax=Stephania yunnanensis TaxID=152371 RepID=A0AAP0NQX7_9MAGN